MQEEITDLATGTINATGDELSVRLVRPADIPAAERTLKPGVVTIAWPSQVTLVSPQRFPEVAAMLARLFAEAATTLAQIKAMRRQGL